MDSSPLPRLDLSQCENEPIRYLAAIQPHGALLVLGQSSRIIEAASDSCQFWLGLPANHLLGQTLGQVFGPAFEATLLANIHEGTQQPSPWTPLPFNGGPLMARSCYNDTGQILVDMEPGSPQDASSLSHQCHLGLEALRRIATEAQLTQAATDLIRTLTGFDQVMIYRFDVDWHGQVVAESIACGVTSYLGHHFPASDIPVQARDLFQLCRVRVIPDVCYVPSALRATSASWAIDLGRSALRSVSGIHIEYLQNMGARATLVGALVVNGQLWGLVSCQHKNEPKFVTPADRENLAWLFEGIATLIEVRQVHARYKCKHQQAFVLRKLVESMRQFDFKQLMHAHDSADLLDVVHADGCALVVGDAVQTLGVTPCPARIRELHQRYLEREQTRSLVATRCLCRDFDLEDTGDGVAGALFLSVFRQQIATLIWFRCEQQRSIKWAGDPLHPHLADEDGRLSPRRSFALFLQNVRCQSTAWSEDDKNAALELGALFEINAVHERVALSRSILNSIPFRIIILNAAGVIVEFNKAWQNFAIDYHIPELRRLAVGLHFRDFAVAVLGRPSENVVRKSLAGIDAVLNGQQTSFSMDHPLGGTEAEHWFKISVSRLETPAEGAVLSHRSIFERKRAEQALARSESHLKEAQQLAQVGSWEWDLATGTNSWSDQQCRIFGYEPGTVHPCYELFHIAVHPDDRAKVMESVENALNNLAEYNVEFRIVRPDRSIRHLHCMGKLERDLDGRPLCMMGTSLDITQRTQTQQRLQSLLSEQKTLLDNQLVGIAKAQNRTIVWANAAFESMLGYDPGELIGVETRRGYVSDQAWQAFGEAAYPMILGKVFRMEVEYVRKDQRTIWVDLSGTVLDAATGTSLWCYIDITARRQADAERQRLHTIIEESPEFIAITDLQARHIYLNKAGAKMVGLPEDADLASLEMRHLHPPRDAQRVMDDILPTVLKQGSWQGENVLLHRDGREIPVYQLLLVHRDKSGHPEHLSSIMRDISRQKAYEREITLATEAAVAANLSKSQFLATMSHEIRTPMNGILGMAQLLLMSDVDKDEKDDYAKTILSSGRTLLNLLNDILDLSKIESGKVQLESIVFEPARLIKETNTLFLGAAQARNLQLQGQWHGLPDQRYRADTYRLQQMLSNLVGNAIKFTHQGTVRLEGTEIDSDGTSALLEFSVTDTGVGIAQGKIDLLFKPFSQTDSSTTREYGGTGLGLSIVRHLAQLMGGDVGIESEVGKGSRFWFRLNAPRVATTESSRSGSAAAVSTGDATEPAALGGWVLVADDNADICKMLEAFLSKQGVNVTLAHNGRQAVDASTQMVRPDLILMDLHMPVMNGHQATRQIRQWEDTHHQPHLPIIAVTADAYAEDHQHCLDSGMDDFVTKPISLPHLQSAVTPWLLDRRGRMLRALLDGGDTLALDQPRFVSEVKTILPLLAHHMFDALVSVKNLQTLTANTPIAADMAEIGLLVEEFRFHRAQERLQALADIGDPDVGASLPPLSKPKILMIDDIPINMLTLGTVLASEYALQIASSGAQGLALAIASPPCLILLDVMMPVMDGFQTCHQIKMHPALKDIPVVFVTATHDMDSEISGLALGAADYITKPIDVEIARQRIRNLLEREHLRQQIQDHRDQLTAEVVRRRQSENVLRKLSVAVEQSPACVIVTNLHARIEYTNPRFTDVTGYSAAEVMGQNPRLLQSGQVSAQTYVQMWKKLASGQVWRGELVNRRKNGEIYWEDTQIAPITNEAGAVTHYVGVKNETTDRKRLEEQVRDLAFFDPLTHLANRRLLDDRLGQMLAACKRNACHSAVMVLDLDNFKPLNDRHGHLVGDLLLVEVARRLEACMRHMDTVARFGGDEFVVILGELDADRDVSTALATGVAEKIRSTLLQPYLLHFTQPDGTASKVEHTCTASIGMVVLSDHEATQDDILKWADSAMYQAKDAGRNAIRLCVPPPRPSVTHGMLECAGAASPTPDRLA